MHSRWNWRHSALALLASSGLLAPHARAQSGELWPESYHAEIWTIARGLPQGSINDLVQTEDGALWAATFGGLVRFDGLEFRVYDLDNVPEMPSNRVTALISDAQGGLWAGLQSGHLMHFRDGKALEVLTVPGPDAQPLSIVRDAQGALWVECLGGSVQRYAQGAWSKLLPSGTAGSYEGVCLNLDGSVCAAAGQELVVFEPDGSERERMRAPARILSLTTGDQHGPWIGLVDGLAYVSDAGIERDPLTLPRNLGIQCILPANGGDLWLGSQMGPIHVSPRGMPARPAQVESGEPMPRLGVRAMLRDREGNIWVGSDGTGLVRLRPHRLLAFGERQERSGVNAIAEDGEGGAWIGLGCYGLYHIPDGHWRPTPASPPALSGRVCIESLLRDSEGRIWLGVAGKLMRLDLHVSSEFQPLPFEIAAQGGLGPMANGRAGGVWISSSSGHIVHLAPDDRVLEQFDLPGSVTSLSTAPDGTLWAGGDGVLWELRAGAIESHGPGSGLPRGVLRDVLCDEDGGVWVASYGGGLGYWKDGRGATISRAEGLVDDSLTAIRADERNRLWILSNQGLMVAQREELLDLTRGRIRSFLPVVLGPEAGMPESEYGAPAAVRDALGRLWFGTITGPVRVDPAEFPFNKTPPKVQLESLQADEVELPHSGRVEIPPLTRRLVLGYTAFALTAPERTRFRYRLDGFDEGWVYPGAQRWVAFTTLAPGDYEFHVAARNEDGVWSAQPARLTLVVLPAWWQRLSVRFAALAAVLGALLLAHRRRVQVIRGRAQVLLEATQGRARAEERESRLREELAHAGRVATAGELASSLAHEVNQPLAAIVTNAQAGRRYLAREPLMREELDEVLGDIAQQGQRASEVIRRLREFLRKHEMQRLPVNLNAVLRDTLPLVRREIEDQGVRTRLELEEGLPAVLADPVQIQQVLVNLVKNACEALSGRPDPREIEIRSRRYDGRVQMDVSDNGPGLAPTVADRLFQPYVTTKTNGMGLGLAICRSIIEAHGGRLGASTRPAGGICFRIDLPVSPGGSR
ncbi:MAG: hypothetical protein IPJ19_01045 [Planctomycetes bacterium]|nr:hypothetical protein [Planctomycetota bacterium]